MTDFADRFQEELAIQHKESWDRHRSEFESARASVASYQRTREQQFQENHAAAMAGFVKQRDAMEQEMAAFISSERARMESEASRMEELLARHEQQVAELQQQRDSLVASGP